MSRVLMGVQMEAFKAAMDRGLDGIRTGELFIALVRMAAQAPDVANNGWLLEQLSQLGVTDDALSKAVATSRAFEAVPAHNKGPTFRPLTVPALEAMDQARAIGDRAGKRELATVLCSQSDTVLVDALTRLAVAPDQVLRALASPPGGGAVR